MPTLHISDAGVLGTRLPVGHPAHAHAHLLTLTHACLIHVLYSPTCPACICRLMRATDPDNVDDLRDEGMVLYTGEWYSQVRARGM